MRFLTPPLFLLFLVEPFGIGLTSLCSIMPLVFSRGTPFRADVHSFDFLPERPQQDDETLRFFGARCCPTISLSKESSSESSSLPTSA